MRYGLYSPGAHPYLPAREENATGLVPTSVPLAPLINIAMAWFPFGSAEPSRGGPLQDFRLRAIKGLLAKRLEPPQLVPAEP